MALNDGRPLVDKSRLKGSKWPRLQEQSASFRTLNFMHLSSTHRHPCRPRSIRASVGLHPTATRRRRFHARPESSAQRRALLVGARRFDDLVVSLSHRMFGASKTPARIPTVLPPHGHKRNRTRSGIKKGPAIPSLGDRTWLGASVTRERTCLSLL